MSESDVLSRAERYSPAEGQDRNGIPAERQFAVIGRAALLPRVFGRVLLFSAKALLKYRHRRPSTSAADQPVDGVGPVSRLARPLRFCGAKCRLWPKHHLVRRSEMDTVG
jgi:hypothetical protein